MDLFFPLVSKKLWSMLHYYVFNISEPYLIPILPFSGLIYFLIPAQSSTQGGNTLSNLTPFKFLISVLKWKRKAFNSPDKWIHHEAGFHMEDS